VAINLLWLYYENDVSSVQHVHFYATQNMNRSASLHHGTFLEFSFTNGTPLVN